MSDMKPLRLIPNPGGDRKGLEFELTVYEGMEMSYEGLVERALTIQFLADAALKGIPIQSAGLQGILAICEEDLTTLGKALATVRERKAQVQERLATKGKA